VLTENNTQQGFFERPDLEAVVAALPDDLRDFTRFAYLTGWRKGEIISLKWTDVDRDAGRSDCDPKRPSPAAAALSCSKVIWPN
jgi:integrase